MYFTKLDIYLPTKLKLVTEILCSVSEGACSSDLFEAEGPTSSDSQGRYMNFT